MSSQHPPLRKKLPIARIAVAGVALAVAAVLVLRGVDVRALIDGAMTLIRDAGPAWFFAAMAVLPAFGAPLLAFTIPAGEAFASQIGMGGVIAAALAAIAVNLALAYWLSRYALRPLLTRLIGRYGYNIPRVTKENALSVLLLVRLTPGPPYALQCFVCGVAELPFRLYMLVSWLAILPWALGGIILGQGLFRGNFRVVLIGAGVLVIAAVALQWLRRKFSRREDGN